MKIKTTAVGVLCIFVSGCIHNSKQPAIIGEADTITEITITDTPLSNKSDLSDSDSVIYELPQCQLWYTKTLPEEYKGEIGMWTEHKNYWENVQVINVFVANPTKVPFDFGRKWELQTWTGKEWITPQREGPAIVWESDLFIDDKAPILYCFRFLVGEYYSIPKGKYRISKTFGQNGKSLDLKAEFEVK